MRRRARLPGRAARGAPAGGRARPGRGYYEPCRRTKAGIVEALGGKACLLDERQPHTRPEQAREQHCGGDERASCHEGRAAAEAGNPARRLDDAGEGAIGQIGAADRGVEAKTSRYREAPE